MNARVDAGARSELATGFLNEGYELLGAGRGRKAAKALDRGLQVLAHEPDLDPAEIALRSKIATGLLSALREAGRSAEVRKRGEELLLAGARDASLAEEVVTRLAFEEKRTDLSAMEIYVAVIESGVSLSRAVRERLNQVLAFGLHIRLTSALVDVRPFVPLLVRLHASRPRLTFARLYLGRYHYLARDYARALPFLSEIEGRLSTSPKILNVTARCREKLGRIDEALATYRTSLDQDFHQPHVHFRIARLLMQRYRAELHEEPMTELEDDGRAHEAESD